MKTVICVKMSLNTEVGFLDQLDHSFLIQFYALCGLFSPRFSNS